MARKPLEAVIWRNETVAQLRGGHARDARAHAAGSVMLDTGDSRRGERRRVGHDPRRSPASCSATGITTTPTARRRCWGARRRDGDRAPGGLGCLRGPADGRAAHRPTGDARGVRGWARCSCSMPGRSRSRSRSPRARCRGYRLAPVSPTAGRATGRRARMTADDISLIAR